MYTQTLLNTTKNVNKIERNNYYIRNNQNIRIIHNGINDHQNKIIMNNDIRHPLVITVSYCTLNSNTHSTKHAHLPSIHIQDTSEVLAATIFQAEQRMVKIETLHFLCVNSIPQ